MAINYKYDIQGDRYLDVEICETCKRIGLGVFCSTGKNEKIRLEKKKIKKNNTLQTGRETVRYDARARLTTCVCALVCCDDETGGGYADENGGERAATRTDASDGSERCAIRSETHMSLRRRRRRRRWRASVGPGAVDQCGHAVRQKYCLSTLLSPSTRDVPKLPRLIFPRDYR